VGTKDCIHDTQLNILGSSRTYVTLHLEEKQELRKIYWRCRGRRLYRIMIITGLLVDCTQKLDELDEHYTSPMSSFCVTSGEVYRLALKLR
jgi:hypothetical protein